jgi:hypothetical protein
MNVVQALLAGLIGALAGYLIGQKRQIRGSGHHDFTIHVKKEGGTYTSETTPKSERVRAGDGLLWKVQDNGSNKLPHGSTVKLKFTEGSPVTPEEPNDRGARIIRASVKPRQERREYPYKVYYSVGGQDFMLEDPELIIE